MNFLSSFKTTSERNGLKKLTAKRKSWIKKKCFQFCSISRLSDK
jgi:hypothetical protein